MADGPRRFAFAFGTFHVSVLVLVVLLTVYARGDLDAFEELGAVGGLLVFAVIWIASLVGTRWALSDVHDRAIDVAIRRGILGGMIAGVLVLAVFLLVVAVGAGVERLRDGDPVLEVLGDIAFVMALYGAISAVVAALIGGAVGFVFSVLDWLVLSVAGIGDCWSPRDEIRRG